MFCAGRERALAPAGSEQAAGNADALSLERYYRRGTDGGRARVLVLAPTREL